MLGNFVALHRQARQKGGRLIFCNVDPTVTEVFRASKLEPLFHFVADRAAALELIARGPETATGDGKTGAIEASEHSVRRHRQADWPDRAGFADENPSPVLSEVNQRRTEASNWKTPFPFQG